MGPMAQDFYQAFGLGMDDQHIAPLDTNGVALASIQGLYEIVQEKDAQISALQTQNADLEARLSALEHKIGALSTPRLDAVLLDGAPVAAVRRGDHRLAVCGQEKRKMSTQQPNNLKCGCSSGSGACIAGGHALEHGCAARRRQPPPRKARPRPPPTRQPV